MISRTDQGPVTVLRIEHGKANALDPELCGALKELFRELEDNARAVVITGSGSIFSAGVDLLRVLDGGAEYIGPFVATLSDFCRAVFSFSRPLVAAINGHAIAGGCVLACMADRRIMAKGSGRIGAPELLVGVPFPSAPLEVLRFAVPPAYLSEIVFGGVTFGQEDALLRGLIEEAVEPSALLDEAVAVAERYAALAPEAFRMTKAQIRRPTVDRMRAGAAAFDADVTALWQHPDTRRAIREYVSRTFKPGA
jgi:enoyl-CoA hydratase/carnithine racemase